MPSFVKKLGSTIPQRCLCPGGGGEGGGVLTTRRVQDAMVVTVVELISDNDPRRRKPFDYDNSVFSARPSENEGKSKREQWQ